VKRETKKKPVGRPKKGLEILCKDWKSVFLDMAERGCAIVEIAVAMGVSRQQMYVLRDNNTEFSDTFARAKELSYAWWLSQGRKNMENREFNNALWAFNMKNRFRDEWGDNSKVQVESTNRTNVTHKIELVTKDEMDLKKIDYKDT